MLEESLDRNTAALTKHSALLEKVISMGGVPAAAAGEAAPRRGRPPGSGAAAKGPSAEDVKAIAERVRDEKSRPEAVALLQQFGAQKSSQLEPKNYAAFIAAAEVLLADGGEDAGGSDDDI